MASVTKRKWTHGGGAKEAWIVRYKDGSGCYRGKQFQRKKDADAYKLKVEREMADGTHIAPRESATVADAAREYLASIDQQVRAGTWRESSYFREEQQIRLRVLPFLSAVRLCDLRPPHIAKLITDLRAGKGATKPLSPVSVGHALDTFARMVDFAVRRKWLAANVVRETKRWKEHRFKKERIRLFTLEQIHALYTYFLDARARNPKLRKRFSCQAKCTVFLAMFCGLRSGEIRGLPIDALDFERGLIHIRQGLDMWNRVGPTKTDAGVRTVPMAEPVAAALQEWVRLYYRPNARGLLFTTNRGTPTCSSNFSQHAWRPALDALGMGPDENGRGYHFHALRHFASAMMVKHMPLADVPAIMGHSHFDTTLMEYAQPTLTAPAKQEAFAAIANDLTPPKLRLIAQG